MDRSAIVTLEAVGTDDSDYELDFNSDFTKADPDALDEPEDQQTRTETSSDDLKGEISKGVVSYVWQEGQQKAKKAFSLYANIDILRPYYDVEPREVRNRLISSLIPKIQSRPLKIPTELYGPTMIVLTLIALLLFQMKSYKITLQEGTLMGSAFVTCFGYWFGISGFLWVAAFVCNTRVTVVQLLNLLGYALFGHCIVISLTVFVHPNHGHLFFYLVWIIFGGLSSLRMASVLMSRTNGRTQKLIVSGIVICLHLFFLFYLHFAYHHVVQDLSEAFAGAEPHHKSFIQSHVDQPLVKPDLEHGVQESFSSASQSVLAAVTKSAKRSLRKGFPKGLAPAEIALNTGLHQ